MNVATKARVDALLDLALNQELIQPEAQELDQLADQDAAVAKQIRTTLLIEAALRARGQAPDVALKVVSDLQQRAQREAEQVVHAVMAQVRTRPKPKVVAVAKPKRLLIISVAATAAMAASVMASIVLRSQENGEGSIDSAAQTSRKPKLNIGKSAGDRLPAGEGLPLPTIALDEIPEPRAAPVERNVLSFDFEDGALPAVFEQGHVVAAPPGATSVYVIQGTFNAWAPGVSTIFANKGGGLFTYHGELILRFKYFLSAAATGLRVQIFDIDQGQNYQWKHPNPVRDAWDSVAIPLSAFYPVKDRSRALEPGDRLQNIFVMGGPIHAAPLLLDDIVLGPDR